MTKTALANKDLGLKEDIARKDRASREKLHGRELKSKEKIARRQNWANIGSSLIKGVSGMAGAAMNDPEWYKRYMPELFRYTNLPTYERLGSSNYADSYFKKDGRAGIMVINYLNSIGPESSTQASINAANQILMRSKEMVLKLNSRSSVNWEAGDLGFNIFASASIVTAMAEAKSTLEIYTTYSPTNAYLAKQLIEARGFNYTDLDDNVADYRKKYLALAKRFNSAIVAPRALSLYDRKWFLGYNVFTDHPLSSGVKQLYCYKSLNFFVLSDDTSVLKSFNRDTVLVTPSLGELFDLIEEQIQKLSETPDYVEMYADLRAAFGRDLFMIPETIEEVFNFNDNELNRIQIHNIKTTPALYDGDAGNFSFFYWKEGTTSGSTYTPGNGDIRQDSSGYLFQGNTRYHVLDWPTYVAATWSARLTALSTLVNDLFTNVLLDSPHDEVDGDEVLDMTRCVIEYSIDANATPSIHLTRCGTEIPVGLTIHYMSQTSGYPASRNCGTIVACTAANSTAFTTIAPIRTYASDFDWSPLIAFAYINSDGSSGYDIHYEMYHAFSINRMDLLSIHKACVLSELYLSDTTFTGSGR